jgi:hypothetical protein
MCSSWACNPSSMGAGWSTELQVFNSTMIPPRVNRSCKVRAQFPTLSPLQMPVPSMWFHHRVTSPSHEALKGSCSIMSLAWTQVLSEKELVMNNQKHSYHSANSKVSRTSDPHVRGLRDQIYFHYTTDLQKLWSSESICSTGRTQTCLSVPNTQIFSVCTTCILTLATLWKHQSTDSSILLNLTVLVNRNEKRNRVSLLWEETSHCNWMVCPALYPAI